MTTRPRHPEISVQLDGEDGNSFDILGRCLKAMRGAGLGKEETDAFRAEAMSGDYDHLLQTCMDWFDVS
jgi:hypothetical protein